MHSIFTRLRRRGFETALVVISALALGGIAVAPAQAVEAGLASFTVVVVDHAGDPVSAELRLTSASGMVVGVEPTIGATGAFEFTGLKVGNYSLRVESVEPLFVSWPSNAYQGDVTLVEGVNPNQRVVLDRLATLSGRVTGKSLNGSAPTPLEGVVVSSSFESAETDANGDFHLATRPGDVRLRFQPSPSSSYSAVYYGGAKDYWDAQIVSASEGAKIAGLDVTLELTSEISGTVSAAAGAPLGETSVNAFELVSGNWRNVGWATTDADGEYTLKVAAGSYRVGFNLYSTSTSNATEYFDDVKTIDDAKDLVVGGGLALAGINAELAPLVTPPTEPTTPPDRKSVV